MSDFDIIFVDNNKTKIGKVFGKGLIISPEQIEDFKRPIFICSMLHADDIMKQTKKMKLNNQLVKIGL